MKQKEERTRKTLCSPSKSPFGLSSTRHRFKQLGRRTGKIPRVTSSPPCLFQLSSKLFIFMRRRPRNLSQIYSQPKSHVADREKKQQKNREREREERKKSTTTTTQTGPVYCIGNQRVNERLFITKRSMRF